MKMRWIGIACALVLQACGPTAEDLWEEAQELKAEKKFGELQALAERILSESDEASVECMQKCGGPSRLVGGVDAPLTAGTGGFPANEHVLSLALLDRVRQYDEALATEQWNVTLGHLENILTFAEGQGARFCVQQSTGQIDLADNTRDQFNFACRVRPDHPRPPGRAVERASWESKRAISHVTVAYGLTRFASSVDDRLVRALDVNNETESALAMGLLNARLDPAKLNSELASIYRKAICAVEPPPFAPAWGGNTGHVLLKDIRKGEVAKSQAMIQAAQEMGQMCTSVENGWTRWSVMALDALNLTIDLTFETLEVVEVWGDPATLGQHFQALRRYGVKGNCLATYELYMGR